PGSALKKARTGPPAGLGAFASLAGSRFQLNHSLGDHVANMTHGDDVFRIAGLILDLLPKSGNKIVDGAVHGVPLLIEYLQGEDFPGHRTVSGIDKQLEESVFPRTEKNSIPAALQASLPGAEKRSEERRVGNEWRT